MKTARPYQNDAIAAVRRDVASGLNRLAIVLPTGAGKGFVIGMARGTFGQRLRTVILANSWELLEQIEGTYREMHPDLSIGIVKAERNEVDADVLLCMIQSMSPERCAGISDVGLILIDECHYAAADSWMRVCNYFGCFDERKTLLIGFTATFVRNDERGLGDLFQKVSYRQDLDWAIRNGFVLKPDRQDVTMPSLDLADVPLDDEGEFDENAIGSLLENPDAAKEIAQLWLARLAGRRTIVFAPTKKAAHALGQAFTAAGITNAVITGDTSRKERKEIFRRGRAGEIMVYINVGVLIAGFDDQGISAVLICTLTRAESRLTQMVGRCMRKDDNDPHKTCVALIIRGVNAQVRTSVELKRTGMKPPAAVPGQRAKAPTKIRVEAEKYRGRYVDGHCVVIRIVGVRETLIAQRKMPKANAQKAIELIIKIDQAKRKTT